MEDRDLLVGPWHLAFPLDLAVLLCIVQQDSSLFFLFNTIIKFLKRFYLFIFREKGREEDRRETSMCGCLSCTPLLGTWSATQAGALTGN